MELFIFTFLLILVGHFFIKLSGKYNLVIILITISSSLIVGTRGVNAGFDTYKYVDYFNDLKYLKNITNLDSVYSLNFKFDYLFKVFTFCLAQLNFSGQEYIFICSFISILLFLYVLRKVFKDLFLCVFLGFFSFPGFVVTFGNTIRQGLALPFMLLSVYYLINGNKKRSVFFIIITFFFHNFTGIIALVVFLGFNFNLLRRVMNSLLGYFIFFIPLLGYLLSSILFRFYPSYYFETVSLVYVYHYTFIIGFLLFVFFKLERKEKFLNDGLMMIFIILLITANFFSFNEVAFGRFLYLPFTFLIYYLYMFFRKYKLELFYYVILFLLGIYFINSEATLQTLS